MEVSVLKRKYLGDDPYPYPYMMVRMNRTEALELMKSLSSMLLDNDPNSGRKEHFISDGALKGHLFSIYVDYDKSCIACSKEVEFFSGTLEKGGYLCKEHNLTHKQKFLTSVKKKFTKGNKKL